MADASLKTRMLGGEILAGTFFKTPAHELVEVLHKSGLDFLCLDAEHAPFDHGRMDVCLALTRALRWPALVRVPTGSPMEILKALDGGANGVVVPHVDSVEKARAVAKAAHFGQGGRGYAGSTRWAGFATRPMPDVLAQDAETIVIAQIEEPEGVEAAEEIAGTPGIDGLFVGPADLAVCYGVTDQTVGPVRDAMEHVGKACAKHGKAFMTFAPDAASGPRLRALGVTMFFVASEQAFMLQVARQTAKDLHDM
ncbi:HpcH/HpaI aldolase/citrate lyase family protein [Jannaschia sp. 2305UL9-9]|uniref:HpcH/HpaI aldolase family protein n=1 Tax=Jannaschia sp. 2305UL9-9 TaxID=3121638 RepID=UPI00352980E8